MLPHLVQQRSERREGSGCADVKLTTLVGLGRWIRLTNGYVSEPLLPEIVQKRSQRRKDRGSHRVRTLAHLGETSTGHAGVSPSIYQVKRLDALQ
jgi:hypothetical protein